MIQNILLRYHEIALKGENRSWFEEKLANNTRKILQQQTGKEHPIQVMRHHGRVIVRADWNESTRLALSRIFGVTSFSPMRPVETSKDALIKGAIEELTDYLKNHPLPRSFRVRTRRSEKALGTSSMEIDRWIGAAVCEAFPQLTVELKTPELILGVELRFKESYLWTQRFPGPGGLPVGTNGHMVTLLSGGLDSPVAAINILKRGATTSLLHFYGTPFVGPEALEKVKRLAQIINRYQPDPAPLNVVPFGKIQEKIALATPPKFRTVLYRRMMLRIAAGLARKYRADAIITGEALGQVASQTIDNLSTISEATSHLVLRPLIAMDKDDIIKAAMNWGTYETSIIPAADCCTLFADKHPSIKTTVEMVKMQESLFPVEELLQQAIESIETHRL